MGRLGHDHRRLHFWLLAAGLGAAALFTPGRANAQRFSTLAPVTGLGNTGSVSEGMLAVGPRYVLQVIQGPLQFYTKSTMVAVGPPLEIRDFFTWTYPAGAGDPICHYDALRGRYLVAAILGAHIYLGISNSDLNGTSDPFNSSNWTKYDINMTGGLPDPGRDTDYPGLGLSDDKLVFTIGAPNESDPKNLVVLDRARAYAGQYNTVITPSDVSIVPLDPTFFYKACRNLTSSNTIHLVAVKPCFACPHPDCNRLDHYTLTGATPVSSSNLTLVKTGVVAASDSRSQLAQQLGASTLPNGIDPMPVNVWPGFADLYMRNNHVTAAWTVGRSYGDGNPPSNAVRVVRFDASTAADAVLDDFVVGLPGIDCVHGSAYEDPMGTVYVSYDRNSPEDYLGSAMIAHRSGTLTSGEFRTSSSGATMERHKTPGDGQAAWGDYTSITMDESVAFANVARIYSMGQYGDAVGPFPATMIGRMLGTYSTGSISGTVAKTILGSTKSGVPMVLFASEQPVDSTKTDANGAFSFTGLPGGSYTVHEVMADGAAVSSAIGVGGVGQSDLTNTDIFVQLKPPNGMTASGIQFVMEEQPLPAVSSVSPNFCVASPPSAITVVVTGQGFRTWSVVRLDGRDRATTYLSTTQLTASLPAAVLRGSRLHAITVFTSGGAGTGLSNAVAFMTTRGPDAISAITLPALKPVTCPGGDADHITSSIVVHDAGTFVAADATATFGLAGCDTHIPLQVWNPPAGSTIGTGSVTVAATKTPGPGAGEYTFSVDLPYVVGCGQVQPSWAARSGTFPSFTAVSVQLPEIDLRSYEVDPLESVSDAVDRYDQQRMTAVLGTQEPCADLDRNGSVTVADQNLLSAHLSHHAYARSITQPTNQTLNKNNWLDQLFSVRWQPGHGPQSRVTLSKIVGSTETVLASNYPVTGEDTGDFPWAACDEPNTNNIVLHLVYTAGPYDSPSAVMADLQTTAFHFSGTCPEMLVSGPVVDSWESGGWQREGALTQTVPTQSTASGIRRLSRVRGEAGGSIRTRVTAPTAAGLHIDGFELLAADRRPDEVAFVAGDRLVVGAPVGTGSVSVGPSSTVSARELLGSLLSSTSTEPVEEDEEEVHPRREAPIDVTVAPLAVELTLKDGVGPVTIESGHGDQWTPLTVLRTETPAQTLLLGPGEDLRARSSTGDARCAVRFVSIRDGAVTRAAPSNTTGPGGDGRRAASSGFTIRAEEDRVLEFQLEPAANGTSRDLYLHGIGIAIASGMDGAPRPDRVELLPAKPNPANNTVEFGFALPKADRVRLQVFDVRGRLIRQLIDGSRPAGRHVLTWDLHDGHGVAAAPGVYFVRMRTSAGSLERKLVVM